MTKPQLDTNVGTGFDGTERWYGTVIGPPMRFRRYGTPVYLPNL